MKKKILFMLAAFDKGGIEKVTLDIVNSLDPNKYDITIYTIWYGGYCQSLVKDYIHVKPLFAKRYIRGVVRIISYLSPRMLYKFFIRGKYDVEIAAGDGECSKIISGSDNMFSKKIAWIHMDVIKRGSQMNEFSSKASAQKIYSKFDNIVCVSDQCKNQFIKKFGYSEKTIVKRNPIDSGYIIKKAEEECTDMSLSKTYYNFIAVGRLVDQKGFDRLLACCNKLINDEKLKFKLNLIGEGPKRDELEKYIADNNLDEYVTLLGFKSNPYKYIKRSDIFILSSRDEAFSLVIGEALVLNKPIIATDCTGIKDWLGESEYGLVCDNSEIGLYTAMKAMLCDDSIVEMYKAVSKKRAVSINFESALKEFEELL